MKRLAVLVSVTVLIIFILISTPLAVKLFLPQARLVMLANQTYTEYVSARGSVIEKSVKNISVEYPFVPGKVFFEVGDSVKAGDIIAKVDLESTQSMLSQLWQTAPELLPASVAVSLSSGNTGMATLMEKYPENIYATANGKLTSLAMTSGTLCEAGVVASISDTDKLYAKVSVNESDISKVKKGQEVVITGAAFKGKSYKGQVEKIYPAASGKTSGTVKETVVDVLVSIKDPNDSIKPGFTVTADIKAGKTRNIFVLPYEAVSQDDEGQEFVYVYKNGMARKRLVQTGAATSLGIEITEGVDKNEFVVYKAENLQGQSCYVNVTFK